MKQKRERREKLKRKLLNKYRLIIINEETFEERVSLRLTRLNVFIAASLSAIFLVVLTFLLIAFTGLREYIPGYPSTEFRQKATVLAYQADSLRSVIEMNEQYLNSIRSVLVGDLGSLELNRDSIYTTERTQMQEVNLYPSREDSLLREEVVREDKYNILETATSKANYAFFSPVSGPVSEGYNVKDNHFGVDIVVAENTPVKSVSDGTVIFGEWTVETGNVIIIEHSYGMISVYKHNSSLIKSQGERVRKGEVIATAGSTGEFSTGPHLHFELWVDGQSVDPTDFIEFE